LGYGVDITIDRDPMPKPLKILAVTLASLVLLVVLLLGAILFLVDPNDFKDDITDAVARATGRQLTLQGDIKLSVFPWLGLSLGETTLGNAPGFGPQPMARVAAVDIHVKLLPLLHKRLETDTLQLHGLVLNLARKADGVTNWDDLAGGRAKAPAPTAKAPAGAPGLAALAIGGLALQNAKVVWDDRQAGQRVVLDKLNLHTGPLAPPAPFTVKLGLDYHLAQPALHGHLDLGGRVSLDLAAQHYRVADLLLGLQAQGEPLPVSPLQLKLAAQVDADLAGQRLGLSQLQVDALGSRLVGQVTLHPFQVGNASLSLTLNDPQDIAELLPPPLAAKGLRGATLATEANWDLQQQTAALKSLRLAAAGLHLDAQAQARHILDAPQATGRLSLQEFSPRQVLQALHLTLPETADPNTLQKASLQLDFEGTADSVSVAKLALKADDTTLGGHASVQHFAQPAIRFQLDVDALDLDRYLPPASEAPPPTPATAAVGATQLPLEPLRALDVDGRLALGKLKVAKLHLSQLELGLTAKGGQLRLHPAKARLYGGDYSGDTRLDVRTDTPKLSLNESLDKVRAGPLLKDLLGDDKLQGTAHAQARLSAEGVAVEQILKTLDGSARVSFRDGAVKGINIGQMLREAYAKLKQLPPPPKAPLQTDFAALSASVAIHQGVASNRDLKATAPALRVSGKGTVDLPRQRLDYHLTTTLVATMKGQGGREAADLKGLPIPIRISGSFSQPKFALDLKPLLEAKAKAELEHQKKKLEEKVDQRLQEEKQKAKEKLEEKLKNKFKGLF
jgi:AsmA protein